MIAQKQVAALVEVPWATRMLKAARQSLDSVVDILRLGSMRSERC